MTWLRDRLDGCIGCGCLSLKNCQLYNPDDRVAALGAGPRYLLGDPAVGAFSSGVKDLGSNKKHLRDFGR